MTTQRKPFLCTVRERRKIMEWLARCREGAELARDNLRRVDIDKPPEWILANIRYWDNVASGFTWSMGMLRKGAKRNATQRKADQDSSGS